MLLKWLRTSIVAIRIELVPKPRHWSSALRRGVLSRCQRGLGGGSASSRDYSLSGMADIIDLQADPERSSSSYVLVFLPDLPVGS
jgi:hypothetical protein